MIQIIFCGDRKWKDEQLIFQVMSLLKQGLGVFTVIEGGALGADRLSCNVASYQLALPTRRFEAQWERYGRAAGPNRNAEMLVEADGVVAFHDNILVSKGTRNMLMQATKAGVPSWLSQNGIDALSQFLRQVRFRT